MSLHAQVLGSWFRIPLEKWISLRFYCVRGLARELITWEEVRKPNASRKKKVKKKKSFPRISPPPLETN
jgi:hypothetical protein